MSLRALIRPIVIATSLVAGLGQSLDALAHGVAHAHEAEHRGSARQPEARVQQQRGEQQHRHRESSPRSSGLQPELTQSDHQHGHVHAIVDTGLKSRSDLISILVSQAPAHALLVSGAVEAPGPDAGSSAPLSERRHTAASPRAPPSR